MAFRYALFCLFVYRYLEFSFGSKERCIHGGVLRNVELVGGFKSRSHALIKGVKNIHECIKECCRKDNCDLAMFHQKHCYSISCDGADSCQISYSKRKSKQTSEIAFNLTGKKSKKSKKKSKNKKALHKKKQEAFETDRDEEESRDMENEDVQSEFADLETDKKNPFSQNKTTADMERVNSNDNMLNKATYVLENSTKPTSNAGLQQQYLPSRVVVSVQKSKQVNKNNSKSVNPYQNNGYYNNFYNGYYSNYNFNNQNQNESKPNINNTNFFNVSGGITTAYQYAINNSTPTANANKPQKIKSTSKSTPTADSFVTEITDEMEENSGEEETIGQSTGVGIAENGAVTAKQESSSNQQAANNSKWYQSYQYQYGNGFNQNHTYYGQYNGNTYPTQNHYVTQIQGEFNNMETQPGASGNGESGDDEPTKSPTKIPTKNLFVDEIQKEFLINKKTEHKIKSYARKQNTKEENAKKKSHRSKRKQQKAKKSQRKNERLLFASTKPTTSPVTQIKMEFENIENMTSSLTNNSTIQQYETQKTQLQSYQNTTDNSSQTQLQSYQNTTDNSSQIPPPVENDDFKSFEQNKNMSDNTNSTSVNSTDIITNDPARNLDTLRAAGIGYPLPVPVFMNMTSGAQYIPLNEMLQEKQKQEYIQQQQQQLQQQQQQQLYGQQERKQDEFQSVSNETNNGTMNDKFSAALPDSQSNVTDAANSQSNGKEVSDNQSSMTDTSNNNNVASLLNKKRKRKRKKHAFKHRLDKSFMNSSDSSRFIEEDSSQSYQKNEPKTLDTNTPSPSPDTSNNSNGSTPITGANEQIPPPPPNAEATTTPSPYFVPPTPAPNPVQVLPTVYMLPLDPNWRQVYENQKVAYYQYLSQNASASQTNNNQNLTYNNVINQSGNNSENAAVFQQSVNETSSGIIDEQSASGSGEEASGNAPEQLSDRKSLSSYKKSLSSYGTNYKKLSEKDFLRSGENHQGLVPIKMSSRKRVRSRMHRRRPAIKMHETLINTGIKANTLLGKMLTHQTEDDDTPMNPIAMPLAPPAISPMVMLAQPENLLTPPSQLGVQPDQTSLTTPLSVSQTRNGESGKEGLFVGSTDNDEMANQALSAVDSKQEILNALSNGPMLQPPSNDIGNENRQVLNLNLNNGQSTQTIPMNNRRQPGMVFNQITSSKTISSVGSRPSNLQSIDPTTLRQLGINQPLFTKSLAGKIQPEFVMNGPLSFFPTNEKKSNIEGDAIGGSIIIAQPHDIGKKGKIEKPRASKRKLSNEKSLNRAKYLSKYHPAAAMGMHKNESGDVSHEQSKALLESLILNTHDPARVDITPDPLSDEDNNDMKSDTGTFISSSETSNNKKHEENPNILDEGKYYGLNYANSLMLKRNISHNQLHQSLLPERVGNNKTFTNNSEKTKNEENSSINVKPFKQRTNTSKQESFNAKSTSKLKNKQISENTLNKEKFAKLHLPNTVEKNFQKDISKHKNAAQTVLSETKNSTIKNENPLKMSSSTRTVNKIASSTRTANETTKSPIENAFKEMLIKELHSDNSKYEPFDMSAHGKLSKNFFAHPDSFSNEFQKTTIAKTQHTRRYKKKTKRTKKNKKNKVNKIKRKKRKNRKRKSGHKRAQSARNFNHKYTIKNEHFISKEYNVATSHSNTQDILHGHPMDGHRFGDADYQSSHKWANHDFSPQPGHYGMHNDTSDNHENNDKFADIYSDENVQNSTANQPNKTKVEEKQQNYKIKNKDGSIETGTELSHTETSHYESGTYKPLLNARKPVTFGMGKPNVNNILNSLPSMIPHNHYPPYYPVFFGKHSHKIGIHTGLPKAHVHSELLPKIKQNVDSNRGMFSHMHVKERNNTHGPPIRYLVHAPKNDTLDHSLDTNLHDRPDNPKKMFGFLEKLKGDKKLNIKREQAITDKLGVFNRLASTLKSNLEAIHKARKQQPPVQAWNTFVTSQKRLDELTKARQNVIQNHGNPSCERGLTVRGATLRGGILSGEFQSMGVVSTQKACTALCCGRKRCDIAMTIGRECINIRCFNKKACTIAPAGHLAVYRNILPVVTFIKRVPKKKMEVLSEKIGLGKRSIGILGLENDDQLENADPKDIAAVKALVTNPKFVS